MKRYFDKIQKIINIPVADFDNIIFNVTYIYVNA